jgi:glutamine synthetase
MLCSGDQFHWFGLNKGMIGQIDAYKREEWRQYINHVSDWERSRYLKFL